MSDSIPIVLDLGTASLKVGRSSCTIPEFVLPNTVGRPLLHSDESFSGRNLDDIMISDETTSFRHCLDLTHPMENGVIKNWEDEKLLLDYVFRQKLEIDPAEHRIVITEAPLTSMDDRKKLLEVFYETLDFNALQITPQAVLVLHAQGLTTGIVVDSGKSLTHIVGVFENYVLPDLICSVNIAGQTVVEYMINLLIRRGYSLHRSADFDIAREITEKFCFVSADIQMDRRIANETAAYTVPYKLPDGRVIKVSGERFEAAEVLFEPSVGKLKEKGLSELIYDTVMNAEINMRKQFFESIVITGGTTLLRGLRTRLVNELKNLVLVNILKGKKERLRDYRISVYAPPGRRFLGYLGGTILADLTLRKSEAWAHKSEYNEDGPDFIANRWQSVSLMGSTVKNST
jgi:actin-related protein 2